jgi:hypothetical protein
MTAGMSAPADDLEQSIAKPIITLRNCIIHSINRW